MAYFVLYLALALLPFVVWWISYDHGYDKGWDDGRNYGMYLAGIKREAQDSHKQDT